MAFDLLNMLPHKGTSEVKTTINTQSIPTDSVEAQKIFAAIRSLMPGQTIQGELLQKEGNSIQLLLSNNIIFNTKLEQDLNLNMGQMITFEVKGNKNGQLVLRPLFENVSQDPNAVKALEAASIKVNDQTLTMVNELMKEGMPVNKDMLANINRQMNLFPDADISDIVLLHKMDLPVNENTLNQIHLYQNNNQWMIENLNEFTGHLTQMLDQVYAEGTDKGDALLSKLLQVFNPTNSEAVDVPLQDNTITNTMQENVTDKQVINENTLKSDTINQDKTVLQSDSALETDMTDINPKLNSNSMEDFFESIMGKDSKATIHKNLLLLMKNEMLMKPEQISEDGYVKQYYEKLHDITSKIENLMKESGKADSSFSKEVTQLKSNVEFMNQINEAYHYIQLPLKMNNSQANGELYVYSRKKSKETDNGKLTALLHLSMEHLGNMDIFLSLEQDKLSTKFSLEKEEMLDFIEEHIDELNARLNKKGYVTDTKVSVMEKKEQDVIHTILQEEPEPRILSKQSFDARA